MAGRQRCGNGRHRRGRSRRRAARARLLRCSRRRSAPLRPSAVASSSTACRRSCAPRPAQRRRPRAPPGARRLRDHDGAAAPARAHAAGRAASARLDGEIASLRGADDRAEHADRLRAPARRELGRPRRRAALRRRSRRSSAKRATPGGRSPSAPGSRPADATALERALEQLRERGEGFRLTLRTPRQRFVEAEGRTVSGRALLRLRDVTGDRLELLRAACASSPRREAELTSLHGAARRHRRSRSGCATRDGAPRLGEPGLPARRRGDGRVGRREPRGARAARPRRPATRRPAGAAAGGAFAARVAAVVGRRAGACSTSPSSRPPAAAPASPSTSRSSSRVRADLQRQMEAHVRTLDQLPTAVAIFDGKQRLVFHNAAYRQLWELDPAFLDAAPDRRRDPRSAARRPQAARAGGFPQLEGRPARRLPRRRAAGDLVASARPAHAARRHQPEPAGRRHLPLRRRHRARPARVAATTR